TSVSLPADGDDVAAPAISLAATGASEGALSATEDAAVSSGAAGAAQATRAGRLIVVAHHLVVDGVSWRILVPDFVAAWGQLSAGQQPELVAPATSMRAWAHALADEAR